MRKEVRTVAVGHALVGAQHIGLKGNGAGLAHAGHAHLGGTRAVVQVTGFGIHLRAALGLPMRVVVIMGVIVGMVMSVPMVMAMLVRVIMALSRWRCGGSTA